jgi:hypothetical protein
VIEPIDANLWIADGPSVSFLGFPYPTRMTLVRLAGGSLWVWSPIALDERLQDEVNALGPVRHLVSPNKLHHLFLRQWADAWPAASLHATPQLARRRRDLRFDSQLGDEPHPAWVADIDQVVVHGSFVMDEVVFFHRSSRTAIIADLVQRFDPGSLHGWRRAIMALDGLVGPNGSTPREWRLSFWNRPAARRARGKVLGWDPQRVIIAHGEWVRDHGRAVLEQAFRWLG